MHSQEAITGVTDQALPDNVNILVVDDDDDIRWFFHYVLSEEGYKVEAVNDSVKALQRIREKEFDIAILDYILPEMKGSQLAEEIKKIKPNMIIVFITGFAEFADEINSGCGSLSEYALIKPVKQDMLIKTIKSII